jgi:hypothetical protein
VLDDEHHDRADERDEQAPDVEAGDSGGAEGVEEEAADDRADDAEDHVDERQGTAKRGGGSGEVYVKRFIGEKRGPRSGGPIWQVASGWGTPILSGMIVGKKYPVPAGTKIEAALDDRRVLLRDGDDLVTFDIIDGAAIERRDVPGLTWARPHGRWLQVQTKAGDLLVNGDLTGPLRPWPIAGQSPKLRLGDLVLVTVFSSTDLEDRYSVLVDLASGEERGRLQGYVDWHDVDAEAGLFLGMSEHDVVAAHTADLSLAWRAEAFTTKVDDPSVECTHGEVRAHAVRRGATQTVRFDRTTGAKLPGDGKGDGNGDEAAPADSVKVAEGVAIVTQGGRTSRVALPLYFYPKQAGRHLVGLVSGKLVELAVVPLPEEGEHALELHPVGDVPEPVGPFAIVKMVATSMPIVIAEHPELGRLNLSRDDQVVAKGDKLVLDGVTKKPGGVVKVSRWSVWGAPPPRDVTHATLPAPKRQSDDRPDTAARSKAPLLADRAHTRGVAVPAEADRFFELLDRDDELRTTLYDLGFKVDGSSLREEFIEDFRGDMEFIPEVFLPLWGDGFDDVGGLLPDGSLVLVDMKAWTVEPVESVGAAVRKAMQYNPSEASVEYALEVLDREGF